ncbi:MAG: DUF4153 domain-containing protein [Firmicutes bacterium]|nr:DUF4153 domain-containing protein [Bacillota bacterium]
MKLPDLLRAYSQGLLSSLKRFPIPLALSASVAILMIVLWHLDSGITAETRETIGKVAMALALGIPVSLCTRLITERKGGFPPLYLAGAYLLEGLALILYYHFWLPDLKTVAVTRNIAFNLSFYLAFLTIPYFCRRDRFELYAIKLLSQLFVTAIFSLVLFLGLAAILFTLESLLGVKTEKYYFDVWFLVVGVFATSFFLSGVPRYDEEFETGDYPKSLRVLLSFIIMPLTAVFTLILYIYFGKIIVTLQWPVGIVANLVLWYSVVCAAIIFFISPLSDENRWFKGFIFWMPKLILPLIIMMFVSMGIRVSAYGITENRYFVIALGTWVLGVMAYLNIARTRRNIIMAVSLSLIAFLCVVGPWSSYSISKLSQNQRLESILSRYEMLSGGTIVRSSQAISDADRAEIQSILRYFNQNHSLGDVKFLPPGFTLDQTKDLFGFTYAGYPRSTGKQSYFTYSSDGAVSPIDISGYSYLILVRSYSTPSTYSSDNLDVLYDGNLKEIKVNLAGSEVYKRSAYDLAKQLIDKFGVGYSSKIDYREMTLYEENEKVRVKYVFQNIHGYRDDSTGAVEVMSLEFLILVSPK